MGVRFRCPNGHKLNVKSFLAGKRGICPKCGIRVQIPICSQDEADSLPPAQAAESDGAALPSRVVTSPVAQVVPEASAPHPRGEDEFPVARAAPEGSAPIADTGGDPIAQAPHAVWYVRPPSGEQYGPASGDVMRSWVAEGRVTWECLVWREGWPDWKPAGSAFASLRKTGVAPAREEVSVAVEIDARKQARRRSKASSPSTVTLVVILTIASAILLGALIYVTTVLG